MTWLAAGGWLLAAMLGGVALALRHRVGLARRAEHELRGPLAALALAVEQVRRGRAGPGPAGVLEAQLERSRSGLADLAAALDGRRASVNRVAVAIDRLTAYSAAGWGSVAARAGKPLRLRWHAGPVAVTADQGRLAQALGNLLSNAVEHGQGLVEVRGRLAENAVRIEVRNSGRFRDRSATAGRGAGSLRRGSEPEPEAGRGRGLSIARQAVEESGGTLRIDSGPVGTTAIVELPLEGR